MTKRDIAAVLEEIAFLLELKGENPFKVKAYATGARVIESLLVGLQGFGQKTQEKILAGIRQYKRRQGFHLYANVIEEAESILAAVLGTPGVVRADHVGEIRRRCEVVQSIAVVVAGGEPWDLVEALAGVPDVTQVNIESEMNRITARSPQGLSVVVMLIDRANYGWELLKATGNTEHVEALTQRLQARGAPVGGETEEAIYAAAGLPYIPPELREGHGEIELAESGRLPVLLESGQIQGVFHTHTIYSDGSATLEQMVEATRTLGYRYIDISDHSQSAFYANGLKEDRIRAQQAEIAAVQKKFPDVRIFKGIEADILVDGAMDYPDEVLATFDFVIASVHSRFNLSEEDQTRRICRALANPYVTMLGHSTGRLLLSRDGYRVDMKQVLDAAGGPGEDGGAHAIPHRLDLGWRLCGDSEEEGGRVRV